MGNFCSNGECESCMAATPIEADEFSAYARAQKAFEARKKRGEDNLALATTAEERDPSKKRDPSNHGIEERTEPVETIVKRENVKLEDLRIEFHFAPGPLGISREGNIVSAVTPGTQASWAGVRVGWACEKIDGRPFNGLELQEKKGSMSNYKLTFRKVVPPTTPFYRIGQKVNCRDHGTEKWNASIVTQLNPLKAKVLAHSNGNVYEWDEVVPSYAQDAIAADPNVWMHRRDDGIEGSFLRRQPDDSPDVGQQSFLQDVWLAEGEKVTVISEKGNWAQVRSISDKTEGYLQKHHLVPFQYVR